MTVPQPYEKSIFHAARRIDVPEARRSYLEKACGDDRVLQARVEALLRVHDEARSFLESPPEGIGTAADDSIIEGPGTVIGPYKLLEQIGEGGMGSVFMAEQKHPVQRRVALKVIKPGMDSRQVVARFEAERQALAMMDHVNIARVFDGGATEAGRPYFVMELVHGEPITKYCDDNHLTPRQRLELFVPVCQAIQHAHQKGIIHRDLKSSNILVAQYDGKPVPKVIDFGIAKATGPRLTEQSIHTEVGWLLGTLEYMSPEQTKVNNPDIDTRSDIYTLGAVLYELLTGSVPFSRQEMPAAEFTDMLRLIKDVDPPKPSTKLTGSGMLPSVAAARQTEPKKLLAMVRGELDWIVMKCLEKDRGRRYETANELANDLQRYLADEPVVAGPPSAGYRLHKFVRRNRGAVLAASLLLLALVGGIVGTTIGLWRAEQARTAEAQRAEGERQAKEIAEQRLAQIEKGNEILGSIFNNLDPRNEAKDGNSLRLLLGKQLENAANQLEKEAVGDPAAVARLQRMLGRSMYGLGHLDQAITLLSKARETLTAHLGPDHADTLGAMENLALAYRTAGKLDLALSLHSEALRLTSAKFGREDPVTLSCMHNLAGCYRSAGKLDLALPLFEETLRLRKATQGADDTGTLFTMNSLGLAYKEAGKLDLAIPMLEEALQLSQAKLGPDDTSNLPILNNLAIAYQSAGKLDLALPRLEEVFKLVSARFGPDHPDTLTTMCNLAAAYHAAAKPEQAIALLQQAVAGVEKLQFQHEYAGRIVGNLVICHEQLKQYELAETWRRKWLAIVKQKAGVESTAYATELAQLGANLLRQNKWNEAETVLRQCLAIRQRKEPDAWTTFSTQALLGGSLFGQLKYTDAEPLLRAGYEGMKLREKTIPPQAMSRMPEAIERLVKLYEAMDKKGEAAKWQKELETIKLAQKPEAKP